MIHFIIINNSRQHLVRINIYSKHINGHNLPLWTISGPLIIISSSQYLVSGFDRGKLAQADNYPLQFSLSFT